MARYRKPDMDLAYGDFPAPDRWDSSRFARESENRRAPVIEQRPPYQSSRREEQPYYEDRRYYEDDYYDRGPRGSRSDQRRFYEQDDYYDPRASAGAMVPFRPERPARPSAAPRPRMVRRQSSVDRFEFERNRYQDDYRPPPPAPRDSRSSRYDIRIYDDVKVQDPEYYGDDGFREYREREWTRSRTRNDDPSPDRRAPTRASVASRSEFIEAAPPEAYEEEIVEEKVVEKPYPRRGKTRMPKRLVHTKVLFDLGYPFYEEDEKTILIEKALGPDNIDEVFAKSKEYREREVTITTTKLLEAGPASVVSPKPISEAPRSVREWDNFNARSPSPGSSVSQATRKSGRRSKSQATRRGSAHESRHESIHEVDRRSRHGAGGSVHESFHEDIERSEHRSVSPAPTGRSSRRRARSRATTRRSDSSDTFVERRTTIIDRSPSRTRSRRGTSVGRSEVIERKIIEKEEIDESNTIDIGPLSLVPKPRTDEDIRAEIRRLEREREDVRRDTEIVRYGRRASRRDTSPIGLLREPSPRGEILVADRRSDDIVAVRKDKRGRSRSRPPSGRLLRSMFYTVT